MMINLKWFILQIYILIVFLTIIKQNSGYAGQKYTKEDILKLREEVREMFNHAYSGYLQYAYPYDELRPLSCDGVDTWGSYSLTLIDALDTLAVMGNYSEFRRVVDIVTSKANFDANINVSVFETNIRIVGGLLSAHLLSHKAGMELEPGWPCNGPLLRLAEDVAKRLIAAFDTSTGMPYGTVNLRHGVPVGETSITCTAGVGTFILEFGTLSRLTGDPIYEEVALNALYALYNHRSSIGLYGNHIDVLTGRWTAQDSGIGAGIDSYLEYLVKGSLLVQRPELMAIFNEGRLAIDKHLKRNDWYLWVSMHKGQVTLPVFQSLEAYWPGILSLIGDISDGMKSMHNYHQVWKQYGFTPEFYNIAQGQVGNNRESYPLRPEFIESTMYLYRATKDPFLLDVGLDVLRSIQHSAKTKCGYATIKDCRDHSLENRMESFFLAETTKYLYLLFDPDNFIHNSGQRGVVHTLPSGRECVLDAGGYIFNTEAHPLDPGALLCCSEYVNEPKRYNRESARGDKFTSFAKQDHKPKPELNDDKTITSPSGEQTTLDLPSAFNDHERIEQTTEDFLERLRESGAVDVVKIAPLASTDELFSVGTDVKSSLNMLQLIETLIDINFEHFFLKTTWSRDLLNELFIFIEAAKEISKEEKHDQTNKESDGSDDNQVLDLPYESSGTKTGPSAEQPSKIQTDVIPNDNKEGDISKYRTINNINKSATESSDNGPNQTVLASTSDNSSSVSSNLIMNRAESNNSRKENVNLFQQALAPQFKIIKDTVLAETTLVMFHLKKCFDNLDFTKNLVEITNDDELKSLFLRRKFDVMELGLHISKSVEETRKLLSQNESGEDFSVELLKKLIDLVVDGKTVSDFFRKYKSYVEVVKKIIAIGKENYEAKITTDFDERINVNSESDMNGSEEINNFGTEDSNNFFQGNTWKADDTSYQVDDRDRVAPVTKVDAGTLFTDKLKIQTESVIGLLPKSLVSSEIPFNPQVLLERIRANPKYERNSTWTKQYELLTCSPQPYFTRIMLSGEFYSD